MAKVVNRDGFFSLKFALKYDFTNPNVQVSLPPFVMMFCFAIKFKSSLPSLGFLNKINLEKLSNFLHCGVFSRLWGHPFSI
jgi:hypothetical protein